MRDLSRPALLIALALLFVVLTANGPGLLFGISISSTVKWVLFGLLIYFIMSGGCCGRSRCCWPQDSDEGED